MMMVARHHHLCSNGAPLVPGCCNPGGRACTRACYRTLLAPVAAGLLAVLPTLARAGLAAARGFAAPGDGVVVLVFDAAGLAAADVAGLAPAAGFCGSNHGAQKTCISRHRFHLMAILIRNNTLRWGRPSRLSWASLKCSTPSNADCSPCPCSQCSGNQPSLSQQHRIHIQPAI